MSQPLHLTLPTFLTILVLLSALIRFVWLSWVVFSSFSELVFSEFVDLEVIFVPGGVEVRKRKTELLSNGYIDDFR